MWSPQQSLPHDTTPATHAHDLDFDTKYQTVSRVILPQKLNGDEEDTLKSFMTFGIMPRRPIFRVVVGSHIVVSKKD